MAASHATRRGRVKRGASSSSGAAVGTAAVGTAAAGTAAAGTAAEEAAVAAPIEHEITSGEENVGPLAGLSNVLPAEPDVVQFGTPSIYSGDLVVSPAQMDYASVLEKMVLSEDLPVQVKKRKLSLPQQLFRWIIAALLYIAILVPVLLGSQNVAMPLLVDMPEETRAVRDLVNSISPGIPVLIAFDYQPGLAGELTTAAAAVIDNLILKGAELVLISTKPTGPGLAEYFLQTTLNEHEYISQNKYSNLGFISGGTAALLNFGTNPRAAIALPLEDGTSGWDQAPLLGINSIQNFGMVIVITDDPDTARAWVEQVQPQMVDQSSGILSTPLVMVVSAQAEPLVYPYYQTSPKQISGMVTGLAGGAYYESGGTRQIIARSFWDGFSSGLTATILILAVGSFINLSRKLISSRSAILGRFRRS